LPLEDLKHLILGEKMASGFFIYRDILDNTPPLAAMLYFLSTAIFGKSILVFQLLATFLIFIQAQIFKFVCNSNELMTEKGDVPALAYIVFSICCYDLLSLSPALISVTFILLALDKIFKHIRSENKESEMFATGFYIGLAYLSFASNFIFLIIALVVFSLFTRSGARFYALMLLGFAFTIISMGTYFYYFDGLEPFIRCYLMDFPVRVNYNFNFYTEGVLLIALPILFFMIVSFLIVFTHNRYINYQIVCQQIMFFTLIIVLGIIILFFSNTLSSFILILPFVSFFTAHYWVVTRRKILANLLLFSFLIHCLLVIYSYFPLEIYPQKLINFNFQISQKGKLNEQYENKAVVVFGKEFNIFLCNKHATPFVNWHLSKTYLQDMEHYESVVNVAKGFSESLPDVIIDEENVMPKIFDRIPFLRRSYSDTPQKGIYEKR
jgi:hypothetical protein